MPHLLLYRRYFENHTTEIREMYRFHPKLQARAQDFIRPHKFSGNVVVALHLRRGDVETVASVSVAYFRRACKRMDEIFAGVPDSPSSSLKFQLQFHLQLQLQLQLQF